MRGPVYGATKNPDWLALAETHEHCRHDGVVGVTAERPGGALIAWKEKCGQSKLCPDESRQETQRLRKRYGQAIARWPSTGPHRRVYSAVLTKPNYPLGQLASGQKELWQSWRDLRGLTEPIPEAERVGRKRRRLVFESIKGAFCVLENPLSAAGDWNVHLNVILLCEGPFDYARFQAEWGHGLHVRQITGGEEAIQRAITEAIKYMATIVGVKSADKADAGSTNAPGMIEWPPLAFAEWYWAVKGTRRTRAYGRLYNLKDDEPPLNMKLVQWVGRVDYVGGRYWSQINDVLPPRGFLDTGGQVFAFAGDNGGEERKFPAGAGKAGHQSQGPPDFDP